MWGYVNSINRIRRATGKGVKVVSTWGNQKAKSGGMGRVFRIFFLSFTRWLLPITPIPKELFVHALVTVHHLTYHTSNKNQFIISHVCGGTWRMTHCLHAFIVNITPEAEVLLKYHTCCYLPVGFAQNRDSLAMVSNSLYTIGLLFGVLHHSTFFWKPEV